MKLYVYTKVASSGVSSATASTKVFVGLEDARAQLAKDKEKLKGKEFKGEPYYEGFEFDDNPDRFAAYGGPEAEEVSLKIEAKSI